jgi:4'-phosphopantetheinyl transferase
MIVLGCAGRAGSNTLTIFALSDREIHVWCASLVVPASIQDSLYQTLASSERERTGRFHFVEHRNAYIVGRGVLRSILSRYCGIAAADVEFVYEEKGKPRISSQAIQFNVSHSHELALYAVAREPLLGVDVEWVRPMDDQENIAKRFFSAKEYAELMSLNQDQRSDAFFNCWTRKEAYVKAIGDGLSAPLDRFQVSLRPGEQALFVSIEGHVDRASEWSLFDVRPMEGYVGAVAVRGRGWQIRQKHWEHAEHLREGNSGRVG